MNNTTTNSNEKTQEVQKVATTVVAGAAIGHGAAHLIAGSMICGTLCPPLILVGFLAAGGAYLLARASDAKP